MARTALKHIGSATYQTTLAVENARADALSAIIQWLHRRGHHEAATDLDNEWWDKRPEQPEGPKSER